MLPTDLNAVFCEAVVREKQIICLGSMKKKNINEKNALIDSCSVVGWPWLAARHPLLLLPPSPTGWGEKKMKKLMGGNKDGN